MKMAYFHTSTLTVRRAQGFPNVLRGFAASATFTELLAFGATHFQSALHLSVQNRFVKDALALGYTLTTEVCFASWMVDYRL
jgi:hypothetical protein